MAKKIIQLVAATVLSISWASGSAAATNDESNQAAPTIIAAAAASQGLSKCKVDKGLYDRLGGIFGIAAVVDRFSDAIIENPALNQNRALVAWNQSEAPTRLPGLKVMRTIWIASLVGGPFKFTGLPLEQAHERLNLSAAEFNAVGAEIVSALQHFNVAQPDIDQLVCLYGTAMDDVVSRTEPKAVSPAR